MNTRRNIGRRSIRLKEYNYSWPGFYFITICTKDRECLLGDAIEKNCMIGPEIELSKLGKIVKHWWSNIPSCINSIELDEFIIMPNHLHGIINIKNSDNSKVGAIHESSVDDKNTVGAIHELPLRELPPHELPPQYVDRRNMLLGKIIGKFKMNSAGEINIIINNAGNSFWQRNYYEHIIRDEKSLHRIRQYIINNPRKWHEDMENPKNNIPIKERNNHYKNLLSDR